VVVGPHDYPLALPLVAVGDAWRFDAAAGRQELLARRIGETELEAIGVCLAYVDAQVLYASKDRDGDGVKSYAQRLVSTPGTQDGLYWATTDDDDLGRGPGPDHAGDALLPRRPEVPSTDHWRILTAQGSHAPGGAYSYILNGRMLAGFALLAVPATHRNTGVMSFLVSNQGKVYEKDLGGDSAKAAAAITTFDPDASWRAVDEATLRTAAATSPEDVPYDDPSIDARTADQPAPGSPGSVGTSTEVVPGATAPRRPARRRAPTRWRPFPQPTARDGPHAAPSSFKGERRRPRGRRTCAPRTRRRRRRPRRRGRPPAPPGRTRRRRRRLTVADPPPP
jgi:hypothetical protein